MSLPFAHISPHKIKASNNEKDSSKLQLYENGLKQMGAYLLDFSNRKTHFAGQK